AAEVAVVLVAAAQVERHTVAQLALEAGVTADARARPVDLVGRLEAGESLSPGELGLATWGRVGPQQPRRLVACLDPVSLKAELTSQHERHCLHAWQSHRPHEVQVPHGLREAEPSRVESRGTRSPHGRVEGVLDEELEI